VGASLVFLLPVELYSSFSTVAVNIGVFDLVGDADEEMVIACTTLGGLLLQDTALPFVDRCAHLLLMVATYMELATEKWSKWACRYVTCSRS